MLPLGDASSVTSLFIRRRFDFDRPVGETQVRYDPARYACAVTVTGGPDLQITWSLLFFRTQYVLIVIAVALEATVGTASRNKMGSTEVMRLTIIRQVLSSSSGRLCCIPVMGQVVGWQGELFP
jgi:hypothetical protein